MRAFIGLLALASLILHGTIIWDESIPQAIALFAAAFVLTCIFDAWRRKAFSPQLLSELRSFQEAGDRVHVTSAFEGEPIDLPLLVTYKVNTCNGQTKRSSIDNFPKCECVTIEFPDAHACWFEVHAHKVSQDYELQPLGVHCFLVGADHERLPFELSDGYAFTAMTRPAGMCSLELELT